jgi:hypothetical protein
MILKLAFYTLLIIKYTGKEAPCRIKPALAARRTEKKIKVTTVLRELNLKDLPREAQLPHPKIAKPCLLQ